MPDAPPNSRCGIDTVEISRIETLLADLPPEDLRKFFSEQELQDAGNSSGRAQSLAARFAAKEACCKLFPKETSLGKIEPSDFSVRRDNYGAPQIEVTPNAQFVLDRHRVGAIRISLTHTDTSASAVALAELRKTEVPWFGKLFYHLIPYRRALVLANLRRVFGGTLPEGEILLLAQAYYAHYIRFLVEFIRLPLMSAEKKKNYIRIENMESPLHAHKKGKGLIFLTGHFGNWEVATVAGIAQFPQFKGLLHFVRRPLNPKWLNNFITNRFHRAGFGTIAKRGSLDTILDLLEKNEVVVYVFDQHAGSGAGKGEAIVSEFFGHPAGTLKSPALLAMSSGAPVIPASSWREPGGTHVVRFEDPLTLVEQENVSEAIRQNTRIFNAALEKILMRHPDQWIWMHGRWKVNGKD